MDKEALLKAKIPCEETGIIVKPAICSFCRGTCTLDVYIKDGEIIKVEGCKSIKGPNNGAVCVKGAALRQAIYNPERLLYPMKRVGARGEGKFERITWDEALSTIAQKMQENKEKYGAKTVMGYVGHPKWFRPQLTQLLNGYGTPNFGTDASTCAYARMMAYELCLGTAGRKAGPDTKNCKTLLIWGVNQMYSSSNYWSKGFLDLVEKGTNVIAVDPRCTPTTERATLHLRPIPGTDGALALGMGRVMITENLYDKEYVEKYTSGFEAYKEYVMQFTPEYVEKITGVPAEDMIRAARMLATERPGTLQMSSSPVVQHLNGVQNTRAIVLLMALIGSYGVVGGLGGPGGGKVGLKGTYGGTMLRRVDAEQDLSYKEFPVWAQLNYHESQITRMSDYLDGKGDYPLHILLGFGTNHHMLPRPDHMEKAFDNLDLFVNADIYMTDTCRYADILLPVAPSIEREQIQVYGKDTVYYQAPVIEPQGEVKNDVQIILELAEKMGIEIGEPALKTYDDYLRMTLEPTGLTLEEVKASPDGAKSKKAGKSKTSEEILGNIKSPSGKIEFVSGILEACNLPGYDGLPIYRDYRDVLPMDEYPLILSTGCRKPQLYHSRTYRLPWLMDLEEAPIIELHPETAEEQNVKKGEIVKLCTPIGSLEMPVVYNSSCLPGTVCVFHGAGEKDINYILDEHYYDPISGFPGFKSYCCKLEKKEA